MVCQFLTLELVRAEIARRAMLKKRERARVKSLLSVIAGGKQNPELTERGQHETS